MQNLNLANLTLGKYQNLNFDEYFLPFRVINLSITNHDDSQNESACLARNRLID